MNVMNIPTQNEIHIVGCREKLQFKQIDKVAKEHYLKDYTIEEAEILDGQTLKLKSYSYTLKY